MRIIVAISVLYLFVSISAFSQSDKKVNECLNMVANGKVDEVKLQLPDLLAEYPDDPGVMLVHGAVIDDAYRALDIYKKIIKDYPESKWADNAYWRIIQFYAVLGDTSQARINLEKFRQNYPTSQFLLPASDIVRSSLTLAKGVKKPAPKLKPAKENEEQTEEKPVVKKQIEKPVEEKPVKATPVQKKALDEDKPDDGTGTYGLQVGAYNTKEAADTEMKKYLRQRMRTEIIEKTVEGEKFFAVVIGNYPSRDAADQAKQIVQQQCGCSPIIFKK
jgi:cell division septation protein DedD